MSKPNVPVGDAAGKPAGKPDAKPAAAGAEGGLNWRTPEQAEQMRRDPPEGSTLYHVTTDKAKLLSGDESVPHTSEFKRKGFHVFDNVEDAGVYRDALKGRGFDGAEIVPVKIPFGDLAHDNEHMGRAFYARQFKPEYLDGVRELTGNPLADKWLSGIDQILSSLPRTFRSQTTKQKVKSWQNYLSNQLNGHYLTVRSWCSILLNKSRLLFQLRSVSRNQHVPYSLQPSLDT